MENLTKERDMLRQAESRLSREKEAMLAEQRNQNLLLTNIKSIQVPDHTIVRQLCFFYLYLLTLKGMGPSETSTLILCLCFHVDVAHHQHYNLTSFLPSLIVNHGANRD